jgi:dolichol-phosphate mannosyltransferase
MKLLLAIPCYNCEKQIVRVINDLPAPLLKVISTILVIDNGSTDKTIENAKKAIDVRGLRTKSFILRNRQNYGLGGSHKVAFRWALENEMDYVAVIHGDHQSVPAELETLIWAAKAEPNLVAILGSRFLPQSKLINYSRIRQWGNRALNFIYTYLCGRVTSDLGSGLNLYKVQPLKLRVFNYTDDFTFNSVLLLDMYRLGYGVEFVPITWVESDQVSNARNLDVGWRILMVLLRWKFKFSITAQQVAPQTYLSDVMHKQESAVDAVSTSQSEFA